MLTEIFKENTYKWETPVNYNDTATYEFEMNEEFTTADIDFITVACGSCTTSRLVENIDNKIFGQIEIAKAVKPDATACVKTIHVYLDPHENRYVIDKNKTLTKVTNPNKRYQILKIMGPVIPQKS